MVTQLRCSACGHVLADRTAGEVHVAKCEAGAHIVVLEIEDGDK